MGAEKEAQARRFNISQMTKSNIYLNQYDTERQQWVWRIIADEIKEQIQKEIQELSALKLAPSIIKDLCQIVEDNFKTLEI